jgi:fumarate reductase subunit D
MVLVLDYAEDHASSCDWRTDLAAELDHCRRFGRGYGGFHRYTGRCEMDAGMKRSIAPVFWLLFGVGGMLSALTGPALVLITGLAAPTGIGVSPDFMSFARATAFAQHPLGKLILFSVIAFFIWHGVERIYLTLRDMHVGGRLTLMWICYGAAGALTIVTVGALAIIGF